MFTLADGVYRPRTTVLWSYTRPGRVVFTVADVNFPPRAGAVYSDSKTNFTVISASIAEGVGELIATGAADPAAAPGTLTKVSGTGTDSLPYSVVQIYDIVTLSLPPGTTHAIVSASANAEFYPKSDGLYACAALSTWPQPVFCNPASGGDAVLYEPDPAATPTLKWKTSGDAVLYAVVYVQTGVHPSTTITETYSIIKE